MACSRGPYRWLVRRVAHRKMMCVECYRLWSSTKLAKAAVLTHRPGYLRLTKPSYLSRATRHPAPGSEGLTVEMFRMYYRDMSVVMRRFTQCPNIQIRTRSRGPGLPFGIRLSISGLYRYQPGSTCLPTTLKAYSRVRDPHEPSSMLDRQ